MNGIGFFPGPQGLLPGASLNFSEGFVRKLPPVQYLLTRELTASFSVEQTYAQEQRLKETGRWVLPNGGREFTMRIPHSDNPGHIRESAPMDGLPPDKEYVLADRVEDFMDIDVRFATDDDGTIHPGYRAFQLTRRRYKNLPTALKLEALASEDNEGVVTWWEKSDWYSLMRHRFLNENELHLASHHYATLVISLLDRNVDKVESPSRIRSNKLTKAGLNTQQPDDDGVQHITLYCPGRISNAAGDGTHASPRMHYRAEHVKMQPHGPRHTLRKPITIAATWVNANDLDPSELGTPIRHIKLAR